MIMDSWNVQDILVRGQVKSEQLQNALLLSPVSVFICMEGGCFRNISYFHQILNELHTEAMTNQDYLSLNYFIIFPVLSTSTI